MQTVSCRHPQPRLPSPACSECIIYICIPTNIPINCVENVWRSACFSGLHILDVQNMHAPNTDASRSKKKAAGKQQTSEVSLSRFIEQKQVMRQKLRRKTKRLSPQNSYFLCVSGTVKKSVVLLSM